MEQSSPKYENIKKKLFTIFTCFLIVALLAAEKAPALLSIAMIGQALSILLFTSPGKLFGNFFREKALLIFSFSYLFLLFSFLYSSNVSYLLERLQIKIPMLLYAIIFPSLGMLTQDQKRAVCYTLIITITACVIGILVNYVLNFDEINALYLQSKIMPGPINHIRFSLLTVFAVCICYYSIQKPAITQKEKWLLIFTGIFLIVFLHIYSVRSGLLSLYLVFMLFLAQYLLRTRNFKRVLAAIGCIIIVSGGSLLLSPTLKNKVVNTTTDVNVYQNKQDPNFNSLATRMVSYEVAMKIFKENVWFGCGQGDLKDENDALFRRDYPSISMPIIPHNQFLYYLAATGITGVLIFTFCFTGLLWHKRSYTNNLLLVCYAVLLIAFQFEPMLETQLGVASTIVILFIPYYLMKEKEIRVSPYTSA